MRNAKRSALIGISGLTLLALFAATLIFTGHSQAAGASRILVAAGNGGYQASSPGTSSAKFSLQVGPTIEKDDAGNSGPSTQKNPPTVAPNPASNGITTQNQHFSGFPALDHFDSNTASNGNQFSLEPPDQGLCVGGNFVIETINDVTAVYSASSHTILSGPTALNAFFGLPVAADFSANPVVFGVETTDPKCYYDSATGHWFMTTLELDLDPASGAFTGQTHVYITVSQTSNPTGAWSIFTFNTSDDGKNNSPSHPGCPCLGDQPLIGADQFGFYISTNEFSFFGPEVNGTQLYAMSKFQLIQAAKHAGSLPSFLQIDVGETVATPDQGGVWQSIQPATSPRLGIEPNHGTEYFLSSLDFFSQLDNRIAVWALTNTSLLGTSHDDQVTLTHTVLRSETYGFPPDALQKSGPTPLADLIQALGDPAQSLEKLAGNDDRMNQVVFADGLLWSGVNTIVQTKNGPARVGAAYFIVQPGFEHGHLAARIQTQGYVSVAGESVLYPSIGVNTKGEAVLAVTLSGPDFFPSAAYAVIDEYGHVGKVHIAGAGVGPEDGFTGYNSPTVVGVVGNGTSRWGDYSAAVAGPNGTIWIANEYIGQTCGDAQFFSDFTCGGTRTVLANWGTFISNVDPNAY